VTVWPQGHVWYLEANASFSVAILSVRTSSKSKLLCSFRSQQQGERKRLPSSFRGYRNFRHTIEASESTNQLLKAQQICTQAFTITGRTLLFQDSADELSHNRYTKLIFSALPFGKTTLFCEIETGSKVSRNIKQHRGFDWVKL
jgi:hypothetical protein